MTRHHKFMIGLVLIAVAIALITMSALVNTNILLIIALLISFIGNYLIWRNG